MANEEIVGGVGITVDADFSDLDAQFDAAIAKAQQRADTMAQAIQAGIKQPDISPVTGALEQIGDVAQKVGQEATGALKIQAPSIDTSEAISSLSSLATAVQSTADEVSRDFAAVAIQGPDLTSFEGALQHINDLTAGAAQAIASEFADIDMSGITSSLGGVGDAASAADAPVQGLAGQLKALFESGQSDTLNTAVSIVNQLGDAANEASGGVQKLSIGAQALVEAQAAADAELARAISVLGEVHDAYVADAVSADVLARAEADVEAAIRAAGTAASEGAAGVKRYSDATQSIIDSQSKADAELQSARGALAEVKAAYEQGAVGANDLARAEQGVASAFQQANPDIQQSQQAAQQASESYGALNTALGFAGIAISIGGFVKLAESIGEAIDNMKRAEIALTNITGSAQQASEMLEKIEKLGLSDGLSIPGLQQAAISMANLLPAGTDVVGTLSLIANGAEIAGKSIEAASQKFDMIAESGKASDKTLSTLGLNISKLKDAMLEAGVNLAAFGDDAKKAFAALDVHDRIVVLQTALQDFGDVAKQVADETFAGAWHKAAAQFDVDVALILKDLGSVSDKSSGLGDALKGAVNVVASVFVGLYTVVKANVDGIIDLLAAAQTGFGGFATALGQAATGHISEAFQTMKDAVSTSGALVKKSWDDVIADVSKGSKTISDLMNQSSTAIKAHVDDLDGYGKHGKDAADKVGAAFAAAESSVQKFDALANSGQDGVAALQRAFENAGKAIDTIAKQNLPEAIKAVDDYTQAQIRNGAGAAVMQEALEKQEKLLNQLAKVDLQGAVDGYTHLVAELSAAKEPLGLIQSAFEEEEKLLAKLGKEDAPAAEAAWQRLIDKLIATNAPLSILNKALEDHHKFLADAADAAEKHAVAMDKAAIAYSNFNVHGSEATRAIREASDAMQKLGLMAADVPPPMDAVNRALADAGVSAQKAKNAFQDLATPIEKIIGDLDTVAAKARDTGDWTNYEKVLESVDQRFSTLSKVSLPQAVTELEAVVQEMIKAGAPTDLVQQQMQKLGAAVKKMADEQLPGAKAAWETYIGLLKQVPAALKDIQQSQEQQLETDKEVLAAMQARGDAYGYILQQQGKVLQEEINIAEKTGGDANQMVASLEAVKLKYQALADASHGYGDIAVQATKDIMNGFGQLSSAMAGAIVDGKNVGDALIGVFKNIAKSILTDLINAAMLPLKIVLENMLASLLGLPAVGAAAAAAVGGSLATMNESAGEATAGLHALGEAASEAAAQINASIASSSGGGGGTLSTVGTIANIAAAGAAIASAILLAHISSDTGHIEVNTRECEAELLNVRKDAWSQFGQTYDRLGECKNALDSISDTLKQMKAAGMGGVFPDSVINDLHDISAHTQPMLAILGALGTIASDIVTWGGYMMTDLDVIVQRLGQLVTSGLGNRDLISSMDGLASDVQNGLSELSTDTGSGLVANAISIGGAIIDSGNRSDDKNTDALNKQLGMAQAQYNAALTLSGQLAGLQSEYRTYESLMRAAIEKAAHETSQEAAQADLALAEQYRQAAANIQAQILPYLSSTAASSSETAIYAGEISTAQSKLATDQATLVALQKSLNTATEAQKVLIHAQIEDIQKIITIDQSALTATQQIAARAAVLPQAVSDVGFAATSAGQLVAMHVDAAAVAISAAVSKAPPASFTPSAGGGTTTPFGGTSTTSSPTSPGVPVGPQPGFGPTAAPPNPYAPTTAPPAPGTGVARPPYYGSGATGQNNPNETPTPQGPSGPPPIPYTPYVAPGTPGGPGTSATVPSNPNQGLPVTLPPLQGGPTYPSTPQSPSADLQAQLVIAQNKMSEDMAKLAAAESSKAAESIIEALQITIQQESIAILKLKDEIAKAGATSPSAPLAPTSGSTLGAFSASSDYETKSLAYLLDIDETLHGIKTTIPTFASAIASAAPTSPAGSAQSSQAIVQAEIVSSIKAKIAIAEAKLAHLMEEQGQPGGYGNPEFVRAIAAMKDEIALLNAQLKTAQVAATATPSTTVPKPPDLPPLQGGPTHPSTPQAPAVDIQALGKEVAGLNDQIAKQKQLIADTKAAGGPLIALEALQSMLASMQTKLHDDQVALLKGEIDRQTRLVSDAVTNHAPSVLIDALRSMLDVQKQQLAELQKGSGAIEKPAGLPTLHGGPEHPIATPGTIQDPRPTSGSIPAPTTAGPSIADQIAQLAITLTNLQKQNQNSIIMAAEESIQIQIDALKKQLPALPGAGGAPASSGPTLDPQLVGFWTAQLAELEDIRTTTHGERDILSSVRDSWVTFQSTAHNDAMLVGQALLDAMGSAIKLPTKSFDHGGSVVHDMTAALHAGEEVLAPDISGTLRRMLSTPSSGFSFANPASDARAGGGTPNFSGPITIHVHGVKNGEELMRDFTRQMKRIVPDSNGYSS